MVHNESQDDQIINMYFEKIDTDGDRRITLTQLIDFIIDFNFDETHIDGSLEEIIKMHLDHAMSTNIDANSEMDKYSWGEAKVKLKSTLIVIFGLTMLTIFPEPLVGNVRQLSRSIKVKPFYISFILIPLATNARTAMVALKMACQRRPHIPLSMIFSEVRPSLFFFTIFTFSYFREFTWHFSMELLAIILNCAIVGVMWGFWQKFPGWVWLMVVILYTLSLAMLYLVDDIDAS
ncbi:hypothetical protein L2E82_37508 [Cichorium intybus]|uniref:Uncharacterized protein n=1 Tax=Cichorium intybus TaxID=13427 RepID=A0ACB9AIS7_CICIN|nr:hypothetical protein L2E82_37508 [Cichorium intybus]